MNKRFFKVKAPVIKGKEGKLVTYPVSYEYNGGIVINNEWYNGYEVEAPIVPDGLCLQSIGCGLQMNCQPPFATSRLVKKEEVDDE